MPDPAPDDLTLDELRGRLGPLLPAEAAFDGWGDATLLAAARTLGVPEERARLAVQGGAVEMIDLWFGSIDQEMALRLPPDQLASLRIRERITALAWARIETAAPHREALRRATAILAMPGNAGMALRLGWRAADAMWRLAGDTATGMAHYTKRVTLGGVYASTLIALLQDESADLGETRAFLARRIDDVMRFEKAKARLRPDPERRFNVTRFLGRLRYPAV